MRSLIQKNFSEKELLGRKSYIPNMTDVFPFIDSKVILVTGGGGSIGAELCRQIAKHNPKQLIIFDVYENNAYDIQMELQHTHPELNLVVLIGSIRDSRKLDYIFRKYKPDIVYHAAAHKHVPLMEKSPCEAIKNNVIGTYKTAFAAVCNGVKKFVLISTDKAVNPTSIMGASKRMCEMIVQCFDEYIRKGKINELPSLFTHEEIDIECEHKIAIENCITDFVSVRFGNVLGSNGSVIPLFEKQIAEGGPVTVTHKDVVRYFMTIDEAVRLVLLASVWAKGGEIFVLDMGEEVRIDDLAKKLIKMYGMENKIDIVYTGLRPGEKLYEEKLMAEEGVIKTSDGKIFIGKPMHFDTNIFLKGLKDLMYLAYQNESEKVIEKIDELVPTYHRFQ